MFELLLLMSELFAASGVASKWCFADVDVAAIDAVAAGAKSDLSLSIEAVNSIVEAAVLLMN